MLGFLGHVFPVLLLQYFTRYELTEVSLCRVRVQLRAYVYGYVWRPDLTPAVFLYLRPGLSLNLELTSELDWLATCPGDPPISSPGLGL